MTQRGGLSWTKLRRDIHEALKLWHAAEHHSGSLSYLCLFRQALRAEGRNMRLATNLILDQALKELAIDYNSLEAVLLRRHFLDRAKMYQVAHELNLAESWLNKKQKQAIDHLTDILYKMESQARDSYLVTLERRLNLPPPSRLIGVDQSLVKLLDLLHSPDSPWLISIEGLGGIGKTALANALIREIAPARRFYDVAWVSAKQQDFLPGVGLLQSDRPALDSATLIDALLEQLGNESSYHLSPPQKAATLNQLLKSQPYLVVIDNLETVIDYQTLMPVLRRLANPTKFLLTSRYMQSRSEVSRFTLTELNQVDTIAFLQYEAKTRGLSTLAEATPDQLQGIYQVVGGNPLALKLVVGQLTTLPLSQVLDSLKQARGKKIDELYTYIYWQAWQTLELASRQALLAMPLAQDGTLEQLAVISRLTIEELQPAIEQLMTLSLIEASGDLEQRHYHIHRLTETFLLIEVVKWQSSL